MSCPNCPTPKEKPQTPASTLNFSASVDTVVGKDGKRYSIEGSLIPTGRRPSGGYRFQLTIAGHTASSPASTAREAFAEASRLLSTNGVEVSARDLWLNLNIQWLQRLDEKYHVVRLADLLEVASGNDPSPAPHKNRANVGPKTWGSKGWGMLQMYLAQDVYEYGTFVGLATELSKWVNPEVNPSIGCADCYIHFTGALDRLRRKALYTQVEARKWLVDTMNAVNKQNGKPVWSFENAAKANHWT